MGMVGTRIRATKCYDGMIKYYPEMLWEVKILFFKTSQWMNAVVDVGDSQYSYDLDVAKAQIDKRIEFEEENKKPNPKMVIEEFILEYP